MAVSDPIELETESPEDAPISEEELRPLRERCGAAGLPVTTIPPDPDIVGDEEMYAIDFPSGREKRRFYIVSRDTLALLLSIPFEKFSFLTDYEAIVSRADQVIEAPLKSLGLFGSRFIEQALGGSDAPHLDEAEPGAVIAATSKRIGTTAAELSIQKVSKDCATLLRSHTRHGSSFSLAIKGIEVPTHDAATSILKKLSAALFLQIDVDYGMPFTLIPRRTAVPRPRRRSVAPSPGKIVFPEHEYDDAPASLYFYGRGARGMPLLQFLAFYQTIEFYFPIYSQAAARRRIRLILKDPTFRADRDADLARILTTIDPGSRFGLGDEKAQLTATINECVDPNELRAYIEAAADMKDFLKTKHKTLTDVRLPIENEEADLRQPLADRIYDIRCRIVHTKGSRRDVDLLLPSSKEAAMLGFDIELVQFIARKTLMAASASLNLP
jgi:hypothetical protein